MDVFEPDDMERLLSLFLQVYRHNLVQLGMGDYMWFGIDGHKITLERKTWADLLASMGRIESQLRMATNHAEEVGLVVEGVVAPLERGEIALYHQAGKGQTWFKRHAISGFKYDAIMAFLWRLDKEGISVYHTSTMQATAWAIKSFVENSQNPQHTILRRYVRTKPISWTPNPVIESLMGIRDKNGAVLGPTRAAEVAKKFHSLGELAHKSPAEIAGSCAGIGIVTAKRLLNAIFQPYVEGK